MALINLRNALMVTSNKEEEMYKEMYLAVLSQNDQTVTEIVDNVTTNIRTYGLYQFNKPNMSFTFNNIVSLASNSFRNINATGLKISLPNCTSASSYAFYGNQGMIELRVPKCKNLGSRSLENTGGLADVYLNELKFSEVSSFPWGSTNANTVFHFKDGDRDYKGNPIT